MNLNSLIMHGVNIENKGVLPFLRYAVYGGAFLFLMVGESTQNNQYNGGVMERERDIVCV